MTGKLYGIGVGPGDSDLLTLKGVRAMSDCREVFVPKGRAASGSLALSIAEKHLPGDASVQELIFPMTSDRVELEKHWKESAGKVAAALEDGKDACFLTLGDPMLYSTYVYLLDALKTQLPSLQVETIPGVTSINAAAALAGVPLGQGRETITIFPAAEEDDTIRGAIEAGGTVVIMKVGKRLDAVISLLEQAGAVGRAVFVSRAGLEGESVVDDLRTLKGSAPDTGYLSIVIIRGEEVL